MRKVIVFGCTRFTKLLKYYMEEDAGIPVSGFCVNRDYYTDSEFEERPVYIFEELDRLFTLEGFEVLIAAGYAKMNSLREQIFKECDRRGYRIASFVHPDCTIKKSEIGRGNIILDGSRISPFSTIGDGNILFHTEVGHGSRIGNFNFLTSSTLAGAVVIGNNCFLGIGSCIANRVEIGSNTLIGGGTYLSKNVQENSVVSPPPPRVITTRKEIVGRFLK